ncbi:diaminopimelate epimerase [Faecalicatena sp. AGMB00832]|uniref:Diaminopimelate epimerase n=1 Tax=Faecalicatena faecalis TaxID=2726362 RepID=A0ABS6D9Z7_9FIRM|nr:MULTISPECIES: diaminopimelate epimerase [Faecalicatena]MBU3878430.1 diaminopimelate epimerase [Faecalicatena faecalis]MCI6464457.1 diaminopimelate epimerase [Faecalicatena sp.]MDY5618335.1 diaminopimelate epimerase [Lachnospiraceae bacterium]
MKITLERYHGLGNDYLVYDPNKNELELNKENVAMLCNRNMGLGSDGILEGPFIGEKHMSLKIWNPDGSIAEKSGNGVRIFAKYLKDAGYVQKKNYHLVTDGGMVEITYLNEDGSRLRISMGKISFWSDEVPVTGERREVINEDMVFGRTLYPVTCVSVGNPHCVIPMREISKPLVCKIGNYSEVARYFPERINTEIMKVIDNNNIAIETFERGAGYTMANGTGACAAAGVAYKLGLTANKVIVHMPGGELQVEIDENWDVYMTGEVFYVAKICLSSEFAEKLRAITH